MNPTTAASASGPTSFLASSAMETDNEDSVSPLPEPTLSSVLADAAVLIGGAQETAQATSRSRLLALPHELILRILYFVGSGTGQSSPPISRTSLFPSPLPSFYPVRLLRLRRVCRELDNIVLEPSLWRTLDLSKERRLEKRDALLNLLERLGDSPRYISLGKAGGHTTSTLGVFKTIDDEIVTIVARNCGKDLARLDLSWCLRLSRFLEPAATTTVKLENLTSLTLAQCRNLDPEFPKILAATNPIRLQSLDLSNCKQISRIAPLATACPSLVRLNVGSTSVNGDSWSEFFGLLTLAKMAPCKLEYLQIDGTPINNDGIGIIARNAPLLKEFDISNTDITAYAVENYLTLLLNMEYLNMKGCRTMDDEESVEAIRAAGGKLRKCLLPLTKWKHWAT